MDVEHPIYDYEINLVKDVLTFQHTWILKSRGLGITEIILRLFAWLCLSSDYFAGKFFHIITGQKEEKAAKLIVRLENILKRNYRDVSFESKYTELMLNKTLIQAFPTKALKDLRGDINVSYMFIDEADFFDPKEQQELPFVIKSYEEKSNAKIIMVSTPNRPDGLFHSIETDQAFKGFFHKLKLNYEVGLDKIYNRKFIEREMQEPEFEREYNLKYLGKIGNVFSPMQIDRAIALGEQYKNLPINQFSLHGCGIDPGFGSSKTAIVVTELMQQEEKIRVIQDDEYGNFPDPNEIVEICFDLNRRYRNMWFYVDGANRGFVTQLKIAFGENPHFEKTEDVSPQSNKIIPVNFRTDHKAMLEYTHILMSKNMIAIPKKHEQLITSLRTAQAAEWNLDKENTVSDDHLDALRLALKATEFES